MLAGHVSFQPLDGALVETDETATCSVQVCDQGDEDGGSGVIIGPWCQRFY
jgi:hypothetical protein